MLWRTKFGFLQRHQTLWWQGAAAPCWVPARAARAQRRARCQVVCPRTPGTRARAARRLACVSAATCCSSLARAADASPRRASSRCSSSDHPTSACCSRSRDAASASARVTARRARAISVAHTTRHQVMRTCEAHDYERAQRAQRARPGRGRTCHARVAARRPLCILQVQPLPALGRQLGVQRLRARLPRLQ